MLEEGKPISCLIKFRHSQTPVCQIIALSASVLESGKFAQYKKCQLFHKRSGNEFRSVHEFPSLFVLFHICTRTWRQYFIQSALRAQQYRASNFHSCVKLCVWFVHKRRCSYVNCSWLFDSFKQQGIRLAHQRWDCKLHSYQVGITGHGWGL